MDYLLQTDRLVLKTLTEEDIPRMFTILHAHPEMCRGLLFVPPKNEADTRDFFMMKRNAVQDGEVIRWGIWMGDVFVGIIALVGIARQVIDVRRDSAEIGYWLSPEYQGQGIMSEAAKAVVDFGFQELKLHTIEAGHVGPNIASSKIIQKLGFRLVGTQKDWCCKDGEWMDNTMYEITADEWISFNNRKNLP